VPTRLTKRRIAATPATDRDSFLWDSEIPGFGLRLWPSGRRVFVFQYRNRLQRTRRLVIGPYSTLTVARARDIARQWATELATGADPSAERKAARQAPTVAALAERYLAEHARLRKKPRSIASDETLLRLHILPALGAAKAASLTRADIQRLHHRMRGTPGAANRTLALLSKMLNLAERWGLRSDGSNPCRHVEKYPEHRGERFLSAAEIARLAAALAEAEQLATESVSTIAAIRLLLFTGARLSEILTLSWEHVDLERRCLRLPDSKTGAKTIYLPAPACEILAGLPRATGNPHVIPGRRPGAHLVNLRQPWSRIRKRAALPGVRLHDLRHSFASMAAAGGLSLPIIGALLGHTQPATTARYAHLAADPLKQAADLIGSRIEAAMASEPRKLHK
jgi:integrase